MRIGFLSDLHGKSIKKFNIKDRDIILLNGDFCKSYLAYKYWIKYRVKGATWKKSLSKKEIEEVKKEILKSGRIVLNSFNEKPVYLIYGNVEKEGYFKFKPKTNVYNINEKIINLENIKIAGVRFIREQWWIDKYTPNVYENNEDKVKEFLDKLGKVDILLCHNPPYGYLDINNNPDTPNMIGKHQGSKLILDYIKRKQPKYCLCGHIHEAKGKTKIGKTIVINGGFSGFEKIEI